MLKGDIIKMHQALEPRKKKGINLYEMPKRDLVRKVQSLEGNSPCYKADFAKSCGQTDCCWFSDCRSNRD